MEGIFNNKSYVNKNVAEIIVSIFVIGVITKKGRNQHVSRTRERVSIKIRREFIIVSKNGRQKDKRGVK